MTVALPGDDEVNLDPPDGAEVRTLARGFIGAIAPPGGPTDLRRLGGQAACHSMTGFSVDSYQLDPLEPEAFAPALRRRNLEFRTRIVQVMEVGELILVPIPPEVTARVGRVAELPDWFERADRPIGEVRDLLGIVPEAPAATASGSVGPWEPGGISLFQIEAGRAAALAAGRESDPSGASSN